MSDNTITTTLSMDDETQPMKQIQDQKSDNASVSDSDSESDTETDNKHEISNMPKAHANKNDEKLLQSEKKIVIKYLTKGKDRRTYIFNLENYLQDKTIRENVIKKIKTDLGTSCAYKETEHGKGYGFAGTHETKLKDKLIKYGKLDKNNFDK